VEGDVNDTTSLSRRGECILRAMQLDRPDLAARLAVGWGDMAERRRVASLMRYVSRKRLEEDAALNAAAAGVPTLTKRNRTNRNPVKGVARRARA
jgi:hypothetical protein